MNFLPGIVDKGRTVVRLPAHGDHAIPIDGIASVPADGTSVTIGLRPGHFNSTGSGPLDLTIEVIEHLGLETFVYARYGKGEIVTIATQEGRDLKSGEPLVAHFDPASILLFELSGAADSLNHVQTPPSRGRTCRRSAIRWRRRVPQVVRRSRRCRFRSAPSSAAC